MNQDDIELKPSYLPYSHLKKLSPVILRNDECLTCFLFDSEKPNHLSIVYVELVKKNECDKCVYIEKNIGDAISSTGDNIGITPRYPK